MPKRLTILALLLLAACGSSPKTHFYTLSVAPGRTAAIGSPVQLAAVHVPPALDRRQMVRMAGANSVEISETNRWSAAFDEMVRNVLAQNLAQRLPRGKLILPNAPAPPGTATLVVTLVSFGPDADGRVKLNGSWTLLGGASADVVREHDVHFDGGPAPDADAAAAAMSRALGELASAMAAGLSRSGI